MLDQTEISITKFVAEGLTNTEIAEKLRLSPQTIKNRMSQMYTKLGINNGNLRIKLVIWWLTTQH